MKELTIQGIKIKAGEKANIEIPIAKLPTHTLIDLPVFIRSSLHEGPVVLISGGVRRHLPMAKARAPRPQEQGRAQHPLART